MAKGPLTNVLERIRSLVEPRASGRAAAPTDAELLGHFAARRDEAAFTELVRRHGGLVLGVCRRVLDDAHDAEDAFQATFLVLARKAGSIRKQTSVASWLFSVARRIAVKARTASARQRAREQEYFLLYREDLVDDVRDLVWRELRPVLDEELSRLPDKYRHPLVLCYLENKTNVEAARQLGWSKGTVSGRLARARELLRARLTRRGLALSGGVLATVLAELAQNASPCSAAVPTALSMSTVKAATLMAAGHAAAGAVSAPVAALVKGAVQAMFLTKIKLATALLVTLGVLGTGAAFFTHQVLGQTPAGTGPRAGQGADALDRAAADNAADKSDDEDDPVKLKKEIEKLKKELARTKKKLNDLLKRADLERARAEAARDAEVAARREAIAERQRAEAEVARALAAAEKAQAAARREAEAQRRVAEANFRRAQDAVAKFKKGLDGPALSSESLKHIGIALLNYFDQHGRLPAHAIYSKDGKPLLSWRVAILPYIEQDALYKQFKLDEAWDSPHNKELIAQMPRIYAPLSEADRKKNTTFYQVFVGNGTLFDGSVGLRLSDIPDGTSNTIAVVEGGKAVTWTKPDDLHYSADKPLPKLGGLFKNGFHILLADGSVRFAKSKVNEKKMRLAITRNDGEPLDIATLDKE
jgi:RNA polymerase sigma factor (sigma-70 family)